MILPDAEWDDPGVRGHDSPSWKHEGSSPRWDLEFPYQKVQFFPVLFGFWTQIINFFTVPKEDWDLCRRIFCADLKKFFPSLVGTVARYISCKFYIENLTLDLWLIFFMHETVFAQTQGTGTGIDTYLPTRICTISRYGASAVHCKAVMAKHSTRYTLATLFQHFWVGK